VSGDRHATEACTIGYGKKCARLCGEDMKDASSVRMSWSGAPVAGGTTTVYGNSGRTIGGCRSRGSWPRGSGGRWTSPGGWASIRRRSVGIFRRSWRSPQARAPPVAGPLRVRTAVCCDLRRNGVVTPWGRGDPRPWAPRTQCLHALSPSPAPKQRRSSLQSAHPQDKHPLEREIQS
jgi:hypothetical protein